MNNAIEVLKRFHDNQKEHTIVFEDGKYCLDFETELAFREALLALEEAKRLDKLIESLENRVWDLENKRHELAVWLEKEIAFCFNYPNEPIEKDKFLKYGFEERTKVLKEVLDRVGEQK